MMPSATGSVSESREPVEPADGHAGGEEREDRYGEAGRDRADQVLEVLGEARSVAAVGARRTGTVKASSTPATVAWTPDAWTSVQATSASGSSSQPDRMRRWTRTPNSAIGTSASAR